MERPKLIRWISSFLGFMVASVLGAIIAIETDIVWKITRESVLENLRSGAVVDDFKLDEGYYRPDYPVNGDLIETTYYICKGSPYAEAIIPKILDGLPKNAEGTPDRFNQPKVRHIKPSWALRRLLQEQLLIVYDDTTGKDETGYVPELFEAIFASDIKKPVQAIANTGKKTAWHISIFMC